MQKFDKIYVRMEDSGDLIPIVNLDEETYESFLNVVKLIDKAYQLAKEQLKQ